MDDFSIRSARAKLKRAETLLGELQDLRDNYIDTFVATVRIEERQILRGGSEGTVCLARDVPELGEEAGLVAGDAMHNVRSALDHVACACVLVNGEPVTDKNAFPIRDKRPGCAFDDLPAVQGMSDNHIRAIERVQPYIDPSSTDSRKLVRLAALDNADKHRIDIPTWPTCVGVVEGEKIVTSRPLDKAKGEHVIYSVSKGGDLRRFPETAEIHPPAKCHAWVPLEYDLAFGHAEVHMAELREIRAYVVGIVESFGPILDRPVP
jgi:hypothetical protein